ncbi:MAG: RNA polymerase sigma factor [Phaeodactylibacter sp.]|nr:RNA polymerase sigma factor [Phaeodactylibacter sp.]
MKNAATIHKKESGEMPAGMRVKSTFNFSAFYRQYAGKVYGKCLAMLGEEVAAEDIAQEIFMKVYLKSSGFRRESSFSTWVFSIAHNSCIDYLRKNKKREQASLEELPFLPILVEEAPWQEAPPDNMSQLARVLEQIPEEDKGILFMKYRDNLSIKEIASALDKSESAVKMRIKRAKAKARERRAELISAD